MHVSKVRFSLLRRNGCLWRLQMFHSPERQNDDRTRDHVILFIISALEAELRLISRGGWCPGADFTSD